MKVFLIGLGSVLVLGLLAWAVMFSAIPSPVQTAVKVVSVSTSTLQESAQGYTIKIDYPHVGIPAIDSQIKKSVEDAAAEFKTLAQPDQSAGSKVGGLPQNSFDGTFESVYVGPDVVSAVLILSQYTGGAHPLTILSGVNFERTTGRKLLLDDALKLIGKSTEQVSAEVTAQLIAKFGQGFFAEGANTNPENFSSFVISADSVTFIFQQYQVAAYVAGPQKISFTRIK